MRNNARMSEQVKDKVLTLMNLALEYNSHETTQELTGNKPTFFVWFNGHTCDLDMAAYTEGYTPNSKCIHESISLASSFSNGTDEEILAALDRWIRLFTLLYSGWDAKAPDIYLDLYKNTELEELFLDEQ